MDILKADVLSVFRTHQAAADALGVVRTVVTNWRDGEPIPRKHALALRYEIRPDAFSVEAIARRRKAEARAAARRKKAA